MEMMCRQKGLFGQLMYHHVTMLHGLNNDAAWKKSMNAQWAVNGMLEHSRLPIKIQGHYSSLNRNGLLASDSWRFWYLRPRYVRIRGYDVMNRVSASLNAQNGRILLPILSFFISKCSKCNHFRRQFHSQTFYSFRTPFLRFRVIDYIFVIWCTNVHYVLSTEIMIHMSASWVRIYVWKWLLSVKLLNVAVTSFHGSKSLKPY